jgi:DNA-binding transcriptional ArsR family regulator
MSFSSGPDAAPGRTTDNRTTDSRTADSRPQQRLAITDVRVLTAFAHPLRLRLLHHLMRTGPSTASRCAEALGDSASNCSYHLRLLSRHGIVERTEVEDGADGRDRPWRAVATGFDFMPQTGDPESVAAHTALVGIELGELMKLFRAFLTDFGSVDQEWQRASAFNSYALMVTPEELGHVIAVFDLLVRPYIITERSRPPEGAKEVSLSLQAVPRTEEGTS